MFDYVIIGAGFSGAVMAQKIATELDKKVLIIEQRQHIAGNCYDYLNEHGILVHQYGPHLFHTDNKEIVEYLSKFTQWDLYQHEVLAEINGQKVPIPFNLNTISKLFPAELAKKYEEALLNEFKFNSKVPILELRKCKDPLLTELSEFIYENIFYNFTKKQWGISPEDIDPDVTARVPIFIGRDNRYFNDKYQMMPRNGYTALFNKMLDSQNIKLLLNTDYKEVLEIDCDNMSFKLFGNDFNGEVIFTGCIDELFNYQFGQLPYRSIDFEFETLPQEKYQDATTVNYPNSNDFTRITEFKHLKPNQSRYTTIVKEYPKDRLSECDIPYYPVFTKSNQEMYGHYLKFLDKFDKLHAVGRLAEYRYYDMDDAVERALSFFREQLS